MFGGVRAVEKALAQLTEMQQKLEKAVGQCREEIQDLTSQTAEIQEAEGRASKVLVNLKKLYE